MILESGSPVQSSLARTQGLSTDLNKGCSLLTVLKLTVYAFMSMQFGKVLIVQNRREKNHTIASYFLLLFF